MKNQLPAHPSVVLALAFLATILLGTGLLMLPLATASGESAPWLTALFTATSAVCVTGLAVVDTGTYWS
ncbi:MAG: TrkH family potassium uptake protein, partial [Betaproteobacteria bacterium]|nr:TrkH family potassium uptake protein [Betaproteobacteria bacterium]